MFSDVIEGLVGLPDAALDDRIREIGLERRSLDAEMAAAIAVAEHRQLPAVDGHRTINAYLRATLNCSSNEASRLRSLARAVDHIDGLGDGRSFRFVAGESVRNPSRQSPDSRPAARIRADVARSCRAAPVR